MRSRIKRAVMWAYCRGLMPARMVERVVRCLKLRGE